MAYIMLAEMPSSSAQTCGTNGGLPKIQWTPEMDDFLIDRAIFYSHGLLSNVCPLIRDDILAEFQLYEHQDVLTTFVCYSRIITILAINGVSFLGNVPESLSDIFATIDRNKDKLELLRDIR